MNSILFIAPHEEIASIAKKSLDRNEFIYTINCS